MQNDELKGCRYRVTDDGYQEFIIDDNIGENIRTMQGICDLLNESPAPSVSGEVERVTEWMPIETAPRDGSNLLLYVDGESLGYKNGSMARVIGYYAKQFTLPVHDDVDDPSKYPDDFEYCEPEGEWYAKQDWYVRAFENQYGDEIAKVVKPTHWMPLPSPPQQRDKREGE